MFLSNFSCLRCLYELCWTIWEPTHILFVEAREILFLHNLIAGKIKGFIHFPKVFVRKWTQLCNWSSNSVTTIPQSIALTITPRGHPQYIALCGICILNATSSELDFNEKESIGCQIIYKNVMK